MSELNEQQNREIDRQINKATVMAVLLVDLVIFCGLIGGCIYMKPKYEVYSQTMVGEAELRRAESNRKIYVLEAEAKKQSAFMLAEADIERAKGVAEANRIIGESLKGNEAYLRWLWVNNLEQTQNSVIYVPTEAGLPILEAGTR
jgi:hypothetical protein